MGVRLQRRKQRNLLASLAYRVNRFLPGKLDIMLDLAAATNRIAWDNAAAAGMDAWGPNQFLQKHIKSTDRVLEIGCSSGRVLSQLRAAERVGVDYDEAAIIRGRNEHPEVTFILGEAREYLKQTGTFDVLILSHVLEHLDDPEEFLTVFKGYFDRIYIEVPDFDSNPLNQVRQVRNRALIYQDEDHVSEFDRDELYSIFRNLEMAVLDSEFRWGLLRFWVTNSATY